MNRNPEKRLARALARPGSSCSAASRPQSPPRTSSRSRTRPATRASRSKWTEHEPAGARARGVGALLCARARHSRRVRRLRPATSDRLRESPIPSGWSSARADLGGARVTAQRYYKDTAFPSVISYLREFARARVVATALVYVDSEAEVGTGSGLSSAYLHARRRYSPRVGPGGARRIVAEDNPTSRRVTNVRVGGPVASVSARLVRHPHHGQDASRGAARRAHRPPSGSSAWIAAVLVAGSPASGFYGRWSPARGSSRTHRGALAPRSTARRSSPAPSRSAAADDDARHLEPASRSSVAYQWQRCDALGLSCVAIPSATGQRYVVGQENVGSRIRVVVTARSSFGSGSAVSPPTAVVPENVPPTNVSPPTIAGTAQVGQTLTAQGAGTWMARPPSLPLAALRCDGRRVRRHPRRHPEHVRPHDRGRRLDDPRRRDGTQRRRRGDRRLCADGRRHLSCGQDVDE